MSAASYDIVPYSADLAPLVLDLQRHLWSQEPELRERYLEWKHHRNPWLERPSIVLALHDGRAVGMRSAFGGRWEAGDPAVRFRMLHADDFVIHPDHRGSGLATRILNAAHQDLEGRGDRFAISMRGVPVTLLSSLATGWKSAGSTAPVETGERGANRRQRWTRLLRRTPYLWRWADRAGRAPIADFARLDAASRGRAPRGLPIEAAESAASEMADVVARLPWDGRIRHVRDVEALAWMLADPMKEHRVLLWRDSAVRGYLLLRRFRPVSADRTIVYLCDWEGEDPEVLAGLLETAIAWGHFGRIGAWRRALPRAAESLLAHAGFTERHERPEDDFPRHLLVRAIGDQGDAAHWSVAGRPLLDPGSWDARMY